ncbi:spectrin beta chain [Schistosoma japonicum]|nr:spectrin beta chain [Schistosoma japonicum]
MVVISHRPCQRTPVIIIKPNEDTQHELNSNKERERLSTVDQQTIVIDVLREQKSLTVDKEIVINSTSRQMDHVS